MKLLKELRAAAIAVGVTAPLLALPLAANATPSKPSFPCQQELKGWDMSQTRSSGHYKVASSGLKVWTDDATSQAKVAGYRSAGDGANLSNMGTPAINWAGSSPAPGLQIVVDIPGGTGWDGVLVGESVYGDNWWLSNSAVQELKDKAPHTGGGNGSNWFGTLAEWNTALEGQGWVSQVGFSLGSGVKGSGTVKSLKFRDTVYTFPCVPVVHSPSATPTVTATATPTATASATPTATATASATPTVTKTPTASATPSTSVAPTTSAPTGSATPTASESAVPTPVGNDAGGLPLTGVKVVGLFSIGAALVLFGGAAYLWARRNREDELQA
jgi:hypothetical protein